MIFNCRTDRAAQMQKKVGRALYELMAHMPYERITVMDLCRRVDLPRRSFYRYFSNKNDVLEYMILDIMQECMLYAMQDVPEEGYLEEVLFRFFTFWRDQRAEWLRVLSENHLEITLIRKFREWFLRERRLQYAGRGISEGQLRTAMTFTLGGMLHLLFQWAEDGFPTDPREMAGYSVRMMTRVVDPSD